MKYISVLSVCQSQSTMTARIFTSALATVGNPKVPGNLLDGGISVSEIKYGIAWSEKYELGNAQVDAQHRRLFELVSDLVEACMQGCEDEKLTETLDFLVNYTIRHFRDEEALQLQYKYPEYESHKQIHDDFKITVSGLVRNYKENGSSDELSSNVNKIIVRWLVNHIQCEDKKIATHIQSMRL